MDENKALVEFLRTGVAPDAGAVVVVAAEKSDPLYRILVALKVVGMLAADLHYRAHGKPFYAIHKLSDIIWDVRRNFDELVEVYYLGERQSVPPPIGHICSKASELVKADYAGEEPTEDRLIASLRRRCEDAAALVEDAKTLALRSGTNAVLDEISKAMLQDAGLLTRTET